MYESPEVVEIGPAQRLTLGMGPTSEIDACDCTRKADIVVIDDGGAY